MAIYAIGTQRIRHLPGFLTLNWFKDMIHQQESLHPRVSNQQFKAEITPWIFTPSPWGNENEINAIL